MNFLCNECRAYVRYNAMKYRRKFREMIARSQMGQARCKLAASFSKAMKNPDLSALMI